MSERVSEQGSPGEGPLTKGWWATSVLAEEGTRGEEVARTWSPGHGGLLASSPRLAARARPQPYAPEAATLCIEHALALARVARDGDANGARVEAVRVEVEERDEQRAEVAHGVRVLGLQEARDQQEEAVGGEAAQVGLVERPLGEQLLDDEGERLGGRPLGERAHHEGVGREAEVLRALEGDIEPERPAPSYSEARREGDDGHEGRLDGAHTLCEHPRLVEQAACQVGLPSILRDGVTPLELARSLRYRRGGAHAGQRHHEVDVGTRPHQSRSVGTEGFHLPRVGGQRVVTNQVGGDWGGHKVCDRAEAREAPGVQGAT